MSGTWLPVPLSPPDRDGRNRKARDKAGCGVPLLTAPPLLDMVELPEGVCIYCNLPGVAPDDISLAIDGAMLHIRAESRLPPIQGKIHAYEFGDTAYESTVELPAIDADRAEAAFSNGLLRVMLPFPPTGGQPCNDRAASPS